MSGQESHNEHIMPKHAVLGNPAYSFNMHPTNLHEFDATANAMDGSNGNCIVLPSSIPNAGLGLYARKMIKKRANHKGNNIGK